MKATRALLFSIVPTGLFLYVHAANTSQAPKPQSEAARAVESAPVPPLAPDDRALVRREFLARLDERIDEMATRLRLEVRLTLDAVLPIPYFGVDTEMTPDGLTLTAIYPETGAERCGLQRGDVLVSFAGVPMDSKPALARTVRSHTVGDVVALEMRRAGVTQRLEARLGPRPEEDEDEVEQFPDLVAPLAPPAAPLTLTFDDDAIGSLPAKLASFLGGHGLPGAWLIVRSDSGRALRQDDDEDKTGIRFPMVIVRGFEAHDCVARVRFRYLGGRIDRAAGVVLRYQNPGNYLVARANAAEGDLRIFRVVNGDRRTLPGAIAKGATDDDRWHTLEFKTVGAQLDAILDGNVHATALDTFFVDGGAGLWTKSDSRTEFDDLQLEALK